MRSTRTATCHVSKQRMGGMLAGAASMVLLALVSYTQLTALTLSDITDRLRTVGASVSTKGEVYQPFFSPVRRFLTVNGDDVQVFEYAVTPIAVYKASKVAPDGMGVGNAVHVAWLAPPHFYAAERLIVVYRGMNRSVMRLLHAVLGPPFAGTDCAGTWSSIGSCQQSHSNARPMVTQAPDTNPPARFHHAQPDDIPLFVRVTFTTATSYDQAVATLEMGPCPKEPYPWTCDEP